ncbi:MAG TPA: ABC transporter permease [Candidatus Mediterraneibacter vanvlietii]|nr:ABC transporter permease [Candidatus Mediterraneibacter vanvlietii]
MKKIISYSWLALVALFLYVPVLILAFYSFTDSTTIGAVRGFSLHNYVTLFTTEELRNMIVGTLLLAVGAAVISSVLGTLGAIGAFYSRPTSRMLVETANRVPVVNADVVTAFSICILLIVVLGIEKNTFIPLVIGHVVMCTPFVYLAVIPRLKQMDSGLYEAALDLGATPFQALYKIVIPQIVPGIVSGFMLSITLSLDDYFISTYTKPATFDTISTYVVNATRGAQTEIKTALWALSTVIFLVVVLAVAIMNLAASRAAKKQEVNAYDSRERN